MVYHRCCTAATLKLYGHCCDSRELKGNGIVLSNSVQLKVQFQHFPETQYAFQSYSEISENLLEKKLDSNKR